MLRFVPEGTECLIVMDLEWNQHTGKTNYEIPHEIIEIGAVKLDRQLHVLESRQYVIRPVVYPKLDQHIRQVTGIDPSELEEGMPFAEAFAQFLDFCGENACLCTWGRDDYPVLLRNARYHGLALTLPPPLDAQMIYAHLLTDQPTMQVGLSNAMEKMGLELDLPAHRALNDALYTARLLRKMQPEVEAAPAEKIEEVMQFAAEEARIAQSDLRSVPTTYSRYEEVLGSAELTAVRCPVCRGETKIRVNWFDGGHGRFMALCSCPQHGVFFAQMHFKRQYNHHLIMHQRVYSATEERIAEVDSRSRLANKMSMPKRRSEGGEKS